MEKSASAPAVRSLALDALRGFAILTMILSGRVPFGVLPGWMYHVQVPPPAHKFNPDIPGISWVDLVFPFFLFSMGAAFPFALNSRIKEGKISGSLILQILKRGLLLAFFAVVIQHVRPTVLSKSPDVVTYLFSLLAFIFMFLIFWRTPSSWGKNASLTLRIAGYAGIAVMLYLIKYPDGSGFKLTRYDIIILVLAHMVVFGALIWIWTRDNLMARAGILILIFAIRLSSPVTGSWLNDALALQPGGWLFNVNFLKYLFIVIPGTMAGDIIYRHYKNNPAEGSASAPGKPNIINLALLSFSFTLICLVGLYTRNVFLTLLLTLLNGGIMYLVIKSDEYFSKSYIKALFTPGMFFLIFGLLLEPFEGGIKKDHSTMSYYMVTSGLAVFMITGFTMITDYLKKPGWLQLLIDNGQNPMLAYAGGTNLLTPLAGLLFIDSFLSGFLNTPWLGVLKGILLTLMLAYMVRIFTHYKIYWRT